MGTKRPRGTLPRTGRNFNGGGRGFEGEGSIGCCLKRLRKENFSDGSRDICFGCATEGAFKRKGPVAFLQSYDRSRFSFNFMCPLREGGGCLVTPPCTPARRGCAPDPPENAGSNSRSWERLRAATLLFSSPPSLPPPFAAPFTLSRCRGSTLPAGSKRNPKPMWEKVCPYYRPLHLGRSRK